MEGSKPPDRNQSSIVQIFRVREIVAIAQRPQLICTVTKDC
jgi:hypothetical protein